MISSSTATSAARRRRGARFLVADDGFGLMEAVVALMIIAGMVLVLMRTFDSSTRVLVESRRQSAANALALELIERAQALEWANMGLAVSTNGASCPVQVGCYSAEFPTLAATADGYDWGSPAEAIVFATGDTFRPFLDFHEQLDRDGTDFDRYIFITSVDDDGDGAEDFRRLTAVVRWTPPKGFRRQVIQTTLVAPFTEPSQPLIRADVSWFGGTVDLQRRVDEVVYEGDPDVSDDDVVYSATTVGGAVIFGSDPLRLGVTFPRLEVTALTDYVSRATVRAESMSIANYQVAGADGIFGTADDTNLAVDPISQSIGADDDNLSSDPSATGPDTWSGAGTVLRDASTGLVVADVPSTERVTTIDGTEWVSVGGSGEVDVLHDDVPGDPVEELPYAAGSFAGPEATRIGVAHDGYGFEFYDRQGALEVEAIADRDDQSAGARDVFGQAKLLYVGTISLLDDDVLSADNADFDGWVTIDPPSGFSSGSKQRLAVSGVGAGETGSFITSVTSVDPFLTLSVWDPDSGTYSEVGTVDFTDPAPGCDDPVASTPGDVQQIEVAYPGATYDTLRYTVHVELDLRGFCESTATDAASNVSLKTWQTAGPMISGEIDYIVEGNIGGTYATIVDFTMVIATDQIIITSAYVDPGAE